MACGAPVVASAHPRSSSWSRRRRRSTRATRWRWRRASSEHSSTGRCASGCWPGPSDHDPPGVRWRGAPARCTSVSLSNPLRHGPACSRCLAASSRVALLTPWPPALTGVAFYSERLAQAMAESVDVDLFIDGDQTELDDRSEAYEVFAGNALADVESSRGGYDAVIACVGNSEHHASALKLVGCAVPRDSARPRRAPDRSLPPRRGPRAIPEGYAAALATIYPSATPDWMDDGWVRPRRLPPMASSWRGSSSLLPRTSWSPPSSQASSPDSTHARATVTRSSCARSPTRTPCGRRVRAGSRG